MVPKVRAQIGSSQKLRTLLYITTKGVHSNPIHGEVFSIQYYVIKFVSDFRQVRCFLRVLRFSPATEEKEQKLVGSESG
jgi:hypothetical protein